MPNYKNISGYVMIKAIVLTSDLALLACPENLRMVWFQS